MNRFAAASSIEDPPIPGAFRKFEPNGCTSRVRYHVNGAHLCGCTHMVSNSFRRVSSVDGCGKTLHKFQDWKMAMTMTHSGKITPNRCQETRKRGTSDLWALAPKSAWRTAPPPLAELGRFSSLNSPDFWLTMVSLAGSADDFVSCIGNFLPVWISSSLSSCVRTDPPASCTPCFRAHLSVKCPSFHLHIEK